MPVVAETEEARKAREARLAAEKKAAEDRILAEKKAADEKAAAELKAKNTVQKTGDAATSTLADTSKGAATKGAELASDAGKWFSDLFKTGGNHIKSLFSNITGSGIAGLIGGGFLAWIIGESFGGGGLFGMILSLMLAIPLAIAGRSFAEGHLAPALQRTAGASPERSQDLAQGHVQGHTQIASLENSNTQQIAETARRKADEVVAKGNPVTYNPSDLPPLLPPQTNNPPRVRT